MEEHFKIYGVIDATIKSACLLSWLSPKSYETANKSRGARPITDCAYEELIQIMRKLDVIEAQEVICRYKFYNTNMKIGQSYRESFIELWGASKGCNSIKQ
ncbi:hypothetical protein ACOME3_008829 [Neoechinorhynchus agilis]